MVIIMFPQILSKLVLYLFEAEIVVMAIIIYMATYTASSQYLLYIYVFDMMYFDYIVAHDDAGRWVRPLVELNKYSRTSLWCFSHQQGSLLKSTSGWTLQISPSLPVGEPVGRQVLSPAFSVLMNSL